MKRAMALALSAGILTTGLSGCSYEAWFGAPEPAPHHELTETGADIAGAESVSAVSSEAEVPGVEVVWQVPLKPVEVYHLRYGLQEQNLDHELTIPVDKLQKLDHPAYGPVFKYQLKDVPKDKDVYVTLRAENRIGLSDASPVIKVSATQ